MLSLIHYRLRPSNIKEYLHPHSAEIYGDFKSEIIKRFAAKEKSKRKTTQLQEIGIGENDLWIAATALRHSLIIVTSDK
ncbi:PIN domain-containing protein [Nostoc sp.]|uniref:PIN domain-containing protein n=1 Tax=Nostoc sp. TaxID=1180 RepID=UPI002FFC3028